MDYERRCGILLPVSSLPSRYGIGCFSKEAYEFVDQLYEAGQSYWQILPLGPTSYGDSPYQSFSTFAGNPYFISLEDLIKEGVLTQAECEEADFGDKETDIDYAKIYKSRFLLLRKAYDRSGIEENQDFIRFCGEQASWLSDYALFMAIKEGEFGGRSFTEWPEDIRLKRQSAADEYSKKLCKDIEFQKYMQFKFYEQWTKLKSYANEKGIKIIGDIPIYVSMDSSDVWSNPGLFQLDESLRPIGVAGCPPDAFSASGQLWGNPLYNWDVHKKTRYSWWIKRIQHCFKMYDVLRIDHFRGFDEYYAIPFGEDTAKNGRWEAGPGMDLFNEVYKELGEQQIIVEDLGYVTDTVKQLVKDSGYPNMRVLEFAFDSRDTGSASDYLPHNYPQNCVVYTGTHDNETLLSWFKNITPDERGMVRKYVNNYSNSVEDVCMSLIRLSLGSVARLCVVPMQDYLLLDDKARMNKPSTIGTNWRWRLKKGQFDVKLQMELRDMAKTYGRTV